MKQQKKKKYKFPQFFIIMFPDGNQTLVKSNNSWSGLIPYTKYLKEDYEEDTKVVVIKWWEAIKFLLKGRVFDVGK